MEKWKGTTVYNLMFVISWYPSSLQAFYHYQERHLLAIYGYLLTSEQRLDNAILIHPPAIHKLSARTAQFTVVHIVADRWNLRLYQLYLLYIDVNVWWSVVLFGSFTRDSFCGQLMCQINKIISFSGRLAYFYSNECRWTLCVCLSVRVIEIVLQLSLEEDCKLFSQNDVRKASSL